MPHFNYVVPNSIRWLDPLDLPDERWKDIDSYEGLYQISDYGRVKRLMFINRQSKKYQPRILKQHRDRDGYLQVTLCKNNKLKTIKVHKLVGKYFVDNPENKPIYNHIKPVTESYCNNHYTNLEPSTYSENVKYAYELGRKPKKNQYKGVIGARNPFSKKVNQYDLNGNLIKEWDCIMDIERKLGYNHSTISAACGNKNRLKTYKGFIWKYNNKGEIK